MSAISCDPGDLVRLCFSDHQIIRSPYLALRVSAPPWWILLFRSRRCRRLNKVARREIAAPQRVILKERPPLPRMKDPDRRRPLHGPLPVYPQPDTPPHPAFFQLLLQTKHFRHSTQGWPLRGPWVALGWPLRGPWVTQGPPSPKPNRQRVANLKKPRGAIIAALQTVIVSERRMPGVERSKIRLRTWLIAEVLVARSFSCQRS
jgi:hypothetical protein